MLQHQYLKDKAVKGLLKQAVNALLEDKPDDVPGFLSNYFKYLTQSAGESEGEGEGYAQGQEEEGEGAEPVEEWQLMMELVTADYHARIQALFEKLDADSNGDLTVKELTNIVGSEDNALGFNAKYFMDWYDDTHDEADGQITEVEFRYYLADIASGNVENDDVGAQKLELVKMIDRFEALYKMNEDAY